jgi:hypothetical protein
MKKILLLLAILSISTISFADSSIRCMSTNMGFEFFEEESKFSFVLALESSGERSEVSASLESFQISKDIIEATVEVDGLERSIVATYSGTEDGMEVYKGTIAGDKISGLPGVVCNRS